MKILFYSDIHLDVRIGQTVPVQDWTRQFPLNHGPDLSPFKSVDLAILPGDIGSFAADYTGATAQGYARQVSEYLKCPVVFVPGNHEWYRGTFGQLPEAPPGVTILDRGQTIIGGIRILGATLWTDYAAAGNADLAMLVAAEKISDHRLIQMPDEHYFMPANARREHFISRGWLTEALLEPHDGPTVIVTHHPPSGALRNPRYPMDALSASFYSDCDHIIELAASAGVKVWIFGHNHHCVDQEIAGIRFLSAQMGYGREDTGWTGPGLTEI